MPILWSFRYHLANGRQGDFREAHDNGSAALQGILRSRLWYIGSLRWQDWREPQFRRLHGDLAGPGEVQFKADGIEQRPLGFVSAPQEFTFLFWAQEKGNKFVPKSAGTIALRRKDEVLVNRECADAVWFALE